MVNVVSKSAPTCITLHCRSLKVKKKHLGTEMISTVMTIMNQALWLETHECRDCHRFWKCENVWSARKLKASAEKRTLRIVQGKKKLFPSFILNVGWFTEVVSVGWFFKFIPFRAFFELIYTWNQEGFFKRLLVLHYGFGLTFNLTLMQIKHGILYTQN